LQHCDGSACARLGHSYFLAGVKGEISASPLTKNQSKKQNGRLEITVDFPKICGANFKTASLDGTTSNMANFTASTLTEILQSREVIDLDSLTIKENEAVWVLYVYVVCMAYDGSSIDLALAAAVAALEDTKLPSLDWDSTKNWYRRQRVPNPSTAVYEGRNFAFLNRPMSLTFVNILDMAWIADPSREEESLGDSLTLCRTNDKWVAIKLGGEEICIQTVLQYLQDVSEPIFESMKTFLDNADDAEEFEW